MCLDYFKEESLNAFESIVLILLSTRSMLLMISAYDLIAMYLAIEFQSLFYVIAALKRDSEFSTEADLNYFILGAFSFEI
jgi:NADH-ubiquinone oxidoreductase chain 2